MQQKLVDLPVMKKCSKCGVEQLATKENFRPRSDRKDRLFAQCRLCMTKYTKENNLKMRATKDAHIRAFNILYHVCRKCNEKKLATKEFFYQTGNTNSFKFVCKKCMSTRKTVEKKCIECNTSFQTDMAYHTICSDDCRKKRTYRAKKIKYVKKIRPEATCLFCSQTYTALTGGNRKCLKKECTNKYFVWLGDLRAGKDCRFRLINRKWEKHIKCHICKQDVMTDFGSRFCDNVSCVDIWYNEYKSKVVARKIEAGRRYCKFCNIQVTGRYLTCTGTQCQKQKTIRHKLRSHLTALQNRSKLRGWDFDRHLFFTYFESIYGVQTKCAVPQCKTILNYLARITACDSSASFDRWDNNLGYTPENTRIICMKCNSIKNKFMMPEVHPVIEYMMKKPE